MRQMGVVHLDTQHESSEGLDARVGGFRWLFGVASGILAPTLIQQDASSRDTAAS